MTDLIGTEKTREQQVPIIDALVNNHADFFQVNVPNYGALAGVDSRLDDTAFDGSSRKQDPLDAFAALYEGPAPAPDPDSVTDAPASNRGSTTDNTNSANPSLPTDDARAHRRPEGRTHDGVSSTW